MKRSIHKDPYLARFDPFLSDEYMIISPLKLGREML